MALLFITHDLSVLTLDLPAAGGDVRRADRRGGAERASCSPSPQHPYTAGAGRRLPDDRRPGVAAARRAGSAATRPTRPSLPPGCPFHPRCARGRRRRARRPTSGCVPAGDGRRAACVHVGGVGRWLTTRPARCSVRDLHVTFASRRGRCGPSTASTSTCGRGEVRRARRRVGVRQDDADPLDRRARAADRRHDHVRRPGRRAPGLDAARPAPRACRWSSRTRPARSTRGTRSTRRWPRGSRIHRVDGHEPTLVADALARAGLRPPRAVRGALPARGVGRPAPAGADRRGDGARRRACCSPTSRWPASTRRSAARSWR